MLNIYNIDAISLTLLVIGDLCIWLFIDFPSFLEHLPYKKYLSIINLLVQKPL